MLDLTGITRRSNQLVLNGLEGIQFGKKVVTIQCTVNDVLKFLDIDRNVQRELDTNKVASIGHYIQYGLDGHDIYFSPLLFSARGRGTYNKEKRQFLLNTGDRIYVLDGQHRIKAFEQLKTRLESMLDRTYTEELEQKYQNLCNFPISLQIFTNLNTEEERQLFTDVNLKASSVHNTLLIMYGDTSKDLYAQMVQEIVDEDTQGIFETRAKTTKTKLMTVSTLYQLCKVLNEGKFKIGTETNLTIDDYSLAKQKVTKFLDGYLKILPKNHLDRDRYVISMSNVILAIGKYVYEVQRESPNVQIDTLLRRIQGYDWTHRNKEFRKLGIDYNHNTQKYNFNAIGRVIPKLSELLIFDQKRKEERK